MHKSLNSKLRIKMFKNSKNNNKLFNKTKYQINKFKMQICRTMLTIGFKVKYKMNNFKIKNLETQNQILLVINNRRKEKKLKKWNMLNF